MRFREWFQEIGRRRWLVVVLQVTAVVVLLTSLGYAFRDAWDDASDRLLGADPVDLGFSLAILASYYLLFTVAWQWILRAWHLRISYPVALQAEMASMLAKYIPGTIFVPAARVAALRRVGIKETPLVLASMILEAGLSALAGIAIFFLALVWLGSSDAPVLPLVALALVCMVGLHPRVFTPLAQRVFKPFGASELPMLRYRTLLAILGFYAGTWLVGGAAVYFLLRAVGGDPEVSQIPYFGGISAVAAIASVLSLITPSGLGVREASTYGLLLAVTSDGVALGATVLNRLTITIVEAALLAIGALTLRNRVRQHDRPGP